MINEESIEFEASLDMRLNHCLFEYMIRLSEAPSLLPHHHVRFVEEGIVTAIWMNSTGLGLLIHTCQVIENVMNGYLTSQIIRAS